MCLLSFFFFFFWSCSFCLYFSACQVEIIDRRPVQRGSLCFPVTIQRGCLCFPVTISLGSTARKDDPILTPPAFPISLIPRNCSLTVPVWLAQQQKSNCQGKKCVLQNSHLVQLLHWPLLMSLLLRGVRGEVLSTKPS